MNAIRTMFLRFALSVPRPKCEPYTYHLDTLKELEAAAMDLTTASVGLADAAQYADEVHDHPSVSIRINAIRRIETSLAELDTARRRAAMLAKTARIELGR